MSLFASAVEHACTGELGRMIRTMALEGCPTHPLFLNIHPAELEREVRRAAGRSDLPAQRGRLPRDHRGRSALALPLCQSVLREVRGRGVYLVVDDLGAGYSNLKYIADLHPKVVKLDRDLIMGLVKETRMFKLVAAIVVLCRELDALVVAEGIETVEELEAGPGRGRALRPGLPAGAAFPPPPGDARPSSLPPPAGKRTVKVHSRLRAVEAHAVSPGALRLVERRVRRDHELARDGRLHLGQRGDADADRHRQARALVVEDRRLDP